MAGLDKLSQLTNILNTFDTMDRRKVLNAREDQKWLMGLQDRETLLNQQAQQEQLQALISQNLQQPEGAVALSPGTGVGPELPIQEAMARGIQPEVPLTSRIGNAMEAALGSGLSGNLEATKSLQSFLTTANKTEKGLDFLEGYNDRGKMAFNNLAVNQYQKNFEDLSPEERKELKIFAETEGPSGVTPLQRGVQEISNVMGGNLPTAEQSDKLNNLQDVSQIASDVMATFDPELIGPWDGIVNAGMSKFVGTPTYSTAINRVNQLRSLVYGLSGKQINETELAWLNSLLPKLYNPDENFLANLYSINKWVASKYNTNLRGMEQDGVVTRRQFMDIPNATEYGLPEEFNTKREWESYSATPQERKEAGRIREAVQVRGARADDFFDSSGKIVTPKDKPEKTIKMTF